MLFKALMITILLVGNLLAHAQCSTEAALPPMSKVPQIDGRIELGEWREAAAFAFGENNQVTDPRRFNAFIGYDRNHLYLAVRSELPPGGELLSNAINANEVVRDDSLEFIVLPPERSDIGPYQFGFFQILVNAKGIVMGVHHEPGYGLVNSPWKPNFQQKHSLDGKFWEAEFAFPLTEFGVKEMKLPSEWKFLVVRNFQQPWSQAAITPIEIFTDKNKFAILKCQKDALPTQVDIGSIARLSPQLVLETFNPGGHKRNIAVTASYGSPVNKQERREFCLSPSQTVKSVFDVEIPPDKGIAVNIQATDESGKKIYYREWKLPPSNEKHKWNNTDSFLAFAPNLITRQITGNISGAKMEFVGNIAGIADKNVKDAIELKKGQAVKIKKSCLPIPGAIACWVKPETKLKGRELLRYWSFSNNSGQFYLQQNESCLIFGFYSSSSKSNKNLVYRTSQESMVGKWTHIMVNLSPAEAMLFVNGIEAGKMKFDSPLSGSIGEFQCATAGTWLPGENKFAIGGIRVFERELSAEEIRLLALGRSCISGKISYLPSLKTLLVEAEGTAKGFPGDLDVTLVVKNIEKEIFSQKLNPGKHILRQGQRALFREAVKLPELPEGKYAVSLSLASLTESSVNGQFLARNFTVKNYPWLKNNLGKSDRIIPPFEPLQVKGNQVSCILRRYLLNNDGLPRQITANGEELLSYPVNCRVVVADSETEMTPRGVRFEEVKNSRVGYTADSENEFLKLTVNGEFDYDGLLRLKLNFQPKRMIDRIYLKIPIKKQIAELFHACGERIRSNPAGKLPDGMGVIWKSRSIPQPNGDNFIPYLWVGQEERGICYAADWDKGWLHCKERDAVELYREENGDISILLNLVNKPFDKMREIEVALMASPVKPMPENWRSWSDNYSKFSLPGQKAMQCLYSPRYWGCYSGVMEMFPAFGDYTYWQKLNETRRTGKIDQEFFKNWQQKVAVANPKDVPLRDICSQEYIPRHMTAGFEYMQKLYQSGKPSLVYLYTCLWDDAKNEPEAESYLDEWQYRALATMVPSLQDRGIYYAAKMLDCGFDGIYLDNTFLVASFSWWTDEGYLDDDGNIHPSFGLWRNREYIKRLATMMVEKGKEPFIQVHQTNANILPMLSWATSSIGMEWKYGDTDFQERFSPDYVRTVNIGLQGGFFPTALDGLYTDSAEKRRHLTRTMLAVLLPHEIQATAGMGTDVKEYKKIAEIIWNFGKAEKDAVFLPYWDKNGPVKSANPCFLTSAYKRERKLLLVCGNYDEDQTMTVKINSKQLGYAAVGSAVNAETGAKLEILDDKVRIPVKKHDLALIELTLDN